jgi:type IV pilus assembly protein PilW
MMSKLPSSRPPRAARGYTMIELVVAITIGVFLLMGLFTILQSTRQGSNEAAALAQLEDNERVAMTILTDMIQNAGYFPDPLDESVTTAFMPDSGVYTYNNAGASGQLFYGTVVTAGSSETMMLRFKTAPGDPIFNCNGGSNSGTGNVVYVNYFKLTTNTQGVSQLGCAVGSDSVSAAAATTMGLVNNVVGMTFAYAINTEGTTASTGSTSLQGNTGLANNRCPADTYKPTAQMTMATYDWTNVCAVKVTLTFNNPLYQLPGQPHPDVNQPQYLTFERVIAVRSKSGIDIINVTPPS